MAAGNPSTIGTGTEVLRRKFVHANSNADVALITGVTDHIFTLLSVVLCELGGAAETFSLYIDPDTGVNNIYLTNEAPISAKGTYVFTEKIVITNTDTLYVWSSTGNVDIYCSYIDQDFS